MKHEEIQNNVLGMLGALGYEGGDVTVTYDDGADTLWFSITSPQTRLLLTREAEALTALNHLAARIVEKTSTSESRGPRVVVDANNHEKKKIDILRTTAHMMAERARYFKASVDLEPMSAHDRRVVHEFLSEATDIKTESAGEGPKRHIVIKYVGGL